MQKLKALWCRMTGAQQKLFVAAVTMVSALFANVAPSLADGLTTTVATPDLVTGGTSQFSDAADVVVSFLYTALPIALVIAVATYIVYRVIGWIGRGR